MQRFARPSKDDIRVTDRNQTVAGRRGHQVKLGPNMGTIFVANNVTAAVATALYPFPVPVPPGAIGYIAMVNISSDTASSSSVYSLLFHSDPANSDYPQAVAFVRGDTPSASSGYAGQVIVPIVKGQACWEVRITGSPQVDWQMYLVGWVLE